jgi:hypothetical protein
MFKLSRDQIQALTYAIDNNGNVDAYSASVTMRTINALSRKGYIEAFGLGHCFCPRTTQYRITKSGRKVLFDNLGGM